MIIHYSLPLKPPKRFETDSNSIIFGRKPYPGQHVDIDLVEDEYVSRLHAGLTCKTGEYWIEDLGSVNGTWVNGVEIKAKTRLTPGDKVQIGWTMIDVRMQPAPSLSVSVSVPDPAPDFPAVVREPAEPMASTPDPGAAPESPSALIEQLERQRPISAADPVPSFFQKEPIPATEGTIVDLTQVSARPYAISAQGTADEMLAQSWRQLAVFNDLCQMLSAAETLDALVQILVEHLRQAIPNAQRGAVLLPDQRGELLLKAHWPPGDHSVSMTWIKRAYDRREPFIWSAAAESTAGNDTPQSAVYYRVRSAMYVPLMLGGQSLGVMYVDNYLTHEAFFGTDLELMRAIANQVAMFVRDHVLRKDLKRKEKLQSQLSRQFSPKIAERIFANGSRLQIGGERMDPVTILVSDVRNFTVLSARMEPDEVVRMLNEMFDAFVPIIFEHDGVVDKYIGDSVLAVFGSPEKDDRQCEKAVRAALEMQHAVHKLQEGRQVRRRPVFDVGISIHTGEVIHGFIGSAERMEYTVIGDTVNRASRYCDGAGAGEVVISKTVYERIYHLVNVQPKVIRTKHPEVEPDLEAFVVKGLKKGTPSCSG
uniref:FHA domain-containing protein n=1 Tax=Candidatus Desulfatibia profunda TaxID=2841695 RepID=A0A8J6NSA7_9BACT|nr:FHA domain-containing protein [Candidatus Desulfatibia profunda]